MPAVLGKLLHKASLSQQEPTPTYVSRQRQHIAHHPLGAPLSLTDNNCRSRIRGGRAYLGPQPTTYLAVNGVRVQAHLSTVDERQDAWERQREDLGRR